MQAYRGTLTSRGQTTIPKEVRRKLGLKPGDLIVYEIEGGQVRLRKVESVDVEWALSIEGTLNEWAGDEDDDL